MTEVTGQLKSWLRSLVLHFCAIADSLVWRVPRPSIPGGWLSKTGPCGDWTGDIEVSAVTGSANNNPGVWHVPGSMLPSWPLWFFHF